MAFRSHQLVRKSTGAVNLSERFLDAPRVHRYRSALRIAVRKVPGQRFDVPVEDDPDDFALLVYGRRSGVASNDVRRRNEVERSLQSEIGLCLQPALRQIVRRFAAVFLRVLKRSAKI